MAKEHKGFNRQIRRALKSGSVFRANWLIEYHNKRTRYANSPVNNDEAYEMKMAMLAQIHHEIAGDLAELRARQEIASIDQALAD